MTNRSPLAAAYRELRRSQSGSMIYDEPAQRPAPIRIYDNTPPRSLADRAKGKWPGSGTRE